MRRTSMSSQTSEGIQTPTPAGHSSKFSGNRRWGPRMACWSPDPTKAMAFIDSNGKTLIICPAKHPQKAREGFPPTVSSGSSTANTSPRTSLPKLRTALDDSKCSHFSGQAPIQNSFRNSPELTLSGLADRAFDNDYLHRGHASGPPGTSFFNNLAAYSNDQEDGDEQEDDDDEGNKGEFEFFHFCNVEEESKSEEDEAEETDQSPPVTTATSHSSQLKTQTPLSKDCSAQNLLNHFDTGVVTAFRRSQHHETIPRHLQDGLLARSDISPKASSLFVASNSLSSIRKRGLE